MKTRTFVKILCSLLIFTLASPADSKGSAEAAEKKANTGADSSIRSIADDPIGEWIEKNAAKYGLYVEGHPAKKREELARPKNKSIARPAFGASSPSSGLVTGHANLAKPIGTENFVEIKDVPKDEAALPPAKEQDAIDAFFVKGVFDVPVDSLDSPSFSVSDSRSSESNLLTLAPSLPPSFDAAENRSLIFSPVGHSPAPLEPATGKSAFVIPVSAAQAASAAAQVSAVMNDLSYPAACDKFATPTGFGVWGKAIIREIVGGQATTLLQGTDDLRRACPNYDFLSVPEKSHVWVNIMASMSFLESSCKQNSFAKGPDGIAAGLLQLHKNHEQKAAPGCSKGDSASAVTSLLCGLSIIEEQIKRTSLLFSRDTHFGVLRPQGDLVRGRDGRLKRIVKARVVVGGIKELPFCQRR